METTVPPGFKFNPPDQELTWHYLYNKVNSKPLPCNAVTDWDIYGYDSSWMKMFEDWEDESLYFLTRLRNWSTQKSGSSSRVMRATKFGTWKCQSDMKIYAGKNHIWSKRTFFFIEKKRKDEEPKKKGYKKATGWTMFEYRLDGCLMHQKEQSSSDYGHVVSRITRPRHMKRDMKENQSVSQIECQQDAPFPEELKQEDNKLEGSEMLLDYNLEAFLEGFSVEPYDTGRPSCALLDVGLARITTGNVSDAVQIHALVAFLASFNVLSTFLPPFRERRKEKI